MVQILLLKAKVDHTARRLSSMLFPDMIKIIREMFKTRKMVPDGKGRKAALTKHLMMAADQSRPEVVHLLVKEFGASGNVSKYP